MDSNWLRIVLVVILSVLLVGIAVSGCALSPTSIPTQEPAPAPAAAPSPIPNPTSELTPTPATSQAKFRISNLRLKPASNKETDYGYIAVDVENIGSSESQGRYVLNIDGAKVSEGSFYFLKAGERFTDFLLHPVEPDGNTHLINIKVFTQIIVDTTGKSRKVDWPEIPSESSETITFVKPAIVQVPSSAEPLQKQDFLVTVISTRQITLTNNSQVAVQVYKFSMKYDLYSYIIHNAPGGGTSYGPIARDILTSEELAVLQPGQSYSKTFNRRDIVAIVSCSFYIKDANTGQTLTVTYP